MQCFPNCGNFILFQKKLLRNTENLHKGANNLTLKSIRNRLKTPKHKLFRESEETLIIQVFVGNCIILFLEFYQDFDDYQIRLQFQLF